MIQWYEVLRETLLVFKLPSWPRTVQRKAIETAKFYSFDTGVVRALRRLPPVSEASADFGEYFKHFVFPELSAWTDYRKPRTPLACWGSGSGYEVDLLLDDRIAIAAKATCLAQRQHLRSLRALAEERLVEGSIVVCREDHPRMETGIET